MERVVCVYGGKWDSASGSIFKTHPIKGEIYEIDGIDTSFHNYYFLAEFTESGINGRRSFNPELFRPVDSSFGEWVEETLMKEVQIEELINA